MGQSAAAGASRAGHRCRQRRHPGQHPAQPAIDSGYQLFATTHRGRADRAGPKHRGRLPARSADHRQPLQGRGGHRRRRGLGAHPVVAGADQPDRSGRDPRAVAERHRCAGGQAPGGVLPVGQRHPARSACNSCGHPRAVAAAPPRSGRGPSPGASGQRADRRGADRLVPQPHTLRSRRQPGRAYCRAVFRALAVLVYRPATRGHIVRRRTAPCTGAKQSGGLPPDGGQLPPERADRAATGGRQPRRTAHPGTRGAATGRGGAGRRGLAASGRKPVQGGHRALPQRDHRADHSHQRAQCAAHPAEPPLRRQRGPDSSAGRRLGRGRHVGHRPIASGFGRSAIGAPDGSARRRLFVPSPHVRHRPAHPAGRQRPAGSTVQTLRPGLSARLSRGGHRRRALRSGRGEPTGVGLAHCRAGRHAADVPHRSGAAAQPPVGAAATGVRPGRAANGRSGAAGCRHRRGAGPGVDGRRAGGRGAGDVVHRLHPAAAGRAPGTDHALRPGDLRHPAVPGRERDSHSGAARPHRRRRAGAGLARAGGFARRGPGRAAGASHHVPLCGAVRWRQPRTVRRRRVAGRGGHRRGAEQRGSVSLAGCVSRRGAAGRFGIPP